MPSVNAVPSSCEPVSMSCRFGVSPTPLMGSPFSFSDVGFCRLLPRRAASSVSPCKSATFCAMRAPFALYQGPVPMRSRALTVGLFALRYACHVLPPAPTAAASVWQCRSAPAIPPRFAPLPDPTLVTKNDIGCGGCAGGCPAGGCMANTRYELDATARVNPVSRRRMRTSFLKLSLTVHVAVGQILSYRIARIGDADRGHISARIELGGQLGIDTGGICGQVQLLVAGDHLVAQGGIERHAILVDQGLDRVVVALRFDPHQLAQQHPHAFAHLLVVLDADVGLAVVAYLLDRTGPVLDEVRDERAIARMVFLDGAALQDAAQLRERGACRVVVHRLR